MFLQSIISHGTWYTTNHDVLTYYVAQKISEIFLETQSVSQANTSITAKIDSDCYCTRSCIFENLLHSAPWSDGSTYLLSNRFGQLIRRIRRKIIRMVAFKTGSHDRFFSEFTTRLIDTHRFEIILNC